MKKVILIDGNAIIHRAYHSMPKTFTNSKGEPTNAVYGFALTLIRVIEDLSPTHMVCSFDLAGPTFRHEKYAGYKATRVKADQELYDQIPKVKELVDTMGIKIIEMQGFEADDIIGTAVKQLSTTNVRIPRIYESRQSETINQNNHPTPGVYTEGDIVTYIVTGDKDAFQLLNGSVFIYDLKRSGDQPRIIDKEAVKKKYDLDPKDFIDLKALSGDSSDNIPGVPGVGDKTATALIQSFGDLDNLYCCLEQKSNIKDQNDKSKCKSLTPRIEKLLIDNKDQAYLSRELGTIHADVPIDFSLEDIAWGEYDKDALLDLFQKLGFRSLISRFSRVNNKKIEKKASEVKKKDQQLKLL